MGQELLTLSLFFSFQKSVKIIHDLYTGLTCNLPSYSFGFYNGGIFMSSIKIQSKNFVQISVNFSNFCYLISLWDFITAIAVQVFVSLVSNFYLGKKAFFAVKLNLKIGG